MVTPVPCIPVCFPPSQKETSRPLAVRLSRPAHTGVKGPFIQSWKTNLTHVMQRNRELWYASQFSPEGPAAEFFSMSSSFLAAKKYLLSETSVGDEFLQLFLFLPIGTSKCLCCSYHPLHFLQVHGKQVGGSRNKTFVSSKVKHVLPCHMASQVVTTTLPVNGW